MPVYNMKFSNNAQAYNGRIRFRPGKISVMHHNLLFIRRKMKLY